MRRRASLLRRESARKETPNDRRNVRRETVEHDDQDGVERPEERSGEDGLGALERFGAELEALFMGPPPKRAAPNVTASAEPAPAPPTPPPTTPASTSLSEIEGELNRLLMEQGIVVRGHDIARVVGLMSGKSIAWAE